MISVMALIQTATALTADSLRAPHQELTEGPAPAGDILGMVFNRVTDSSQKGIDYDRSAVALDGISQFSCPSISAGMSGAAAGDLDLALGVPGHLIRDMQPILCLQNTVVAPPAPEAGGLKRMSILRKRPDISAETFQEEWFNLHATLVRRLPGLRGYRQNLVLDGPSDPDGHRMVDGMVELWFDDGAAIDAAFGSGAGRTTMAHAREFIAEISTFLVEPTRLHGLP
ncbi:EthD family reductase [Salipiger abyssi]|uniref:EthD family reductase n=1 Tax=Salipiger abyssi TaxID=1250539 RepID=UPI00405904E2